MSDDDDQEIVDNFFPSDSVGQEIVNDRRSIDQSPSIRRLDRIFGGNKATVHRGLPEVFEEIVFGSFSEVDDIPNVIRRTNNIEAIPENTHQSSHLESRCSNIVVTSREGFEDDQYSFIKE